MFNGNKLTELRLLYGLTRSELADKLDISEQAVWQFETNKGGKPKLNPTLLTIAKLFNVDISYFEGEIETSNIDTSRIAFRNGDADSKKAIQIEEVYLNKIHQLILSLETYLNPPQLTIYSLLEEVEQIIQDKILDEILLEKVAIIARKKLNLASDNENLLFCMELSGINILTRVLSNKGKADAYSLWTLDDTPYIVLGNGKSAVRRNFDLAHELAHLLLHRAVDFEELSKKELDIKEREANLFASYLLMPTEQFLKDFSSYVGEKVSNPDYYIQLKRKYNVSIQALEMRAYKLGKLSVAQNSYFYRTISKKNYKLVEPLDYDILVKKPSKIRSMFDVVFSNHLVDLPTFLHQRGITKQFLCNLLDIEVEFFEKYLQQSSDFNQIIKIADYKRKA